VKNNGLLPHSTKKIATKFGLFHDQVAEILDSANDTIINMSRNGEKTGSADTLWISKESFKNLSNKILDILRDFHKMNPEKPALDQLKLIKKSELNLNESVWNFAFEQLTIDWSIKFGFNSRRRSADRF